jgi:chitinase
MKKTLLFLILFSCFFCSAQPSNKIIAYYTGKGELIKQWPVQKLTHIICSFLRVRNDSLMFRDSVQQQTIVQLVNLKKEYPWLKIMVSVGGWGGCEFCSDMFAAENRRLTFAKTTAALFKQYGIDGLDLDWEYPAIEGYPNHKYDPADKKNFTEMVKVLRQEMGNNYLLTFAAGGFVKYLEESIDWNAVIPFVDFVNLMTYDLVNGYSTITGHHTPLYTYKKGQESTDKCVKWLLNEKVPAEKLIIGAAIYARIWGNVPDTNHGLYQSGVFKRGLSYAEFSTYFSDTSGFKMYWDRRAKAPYAFNAAQNLFATFDDKKSIKAKTKYIRRKKLGGMMFWQLGEDAKENGLVDEMYKGLK